MRIQNCRSHLTQYRYSIRVGRSNSPRGPFIDKAGTDLVEGGGELVYGSNGDTYAPGGQSVIRDGDTDVLYYHYCKFFLHDCTLEICTDIFTVNRTVGIAFQVSIHFLAGLWTMITYRGLSTPVDPPSLPLALYAASHHDLI